VDWEMTEAEDSHPKSTVIACQKFVFVCSPVQASLRSQPYSKSTQMRHSFATFPLSFCYRQLYLVRWNFARMHTEKTCLTSEFCCKKHSCSKCFEAFADLGVGRQNVIKIEQRLTYSNAHQTVLHAALSALSIIKRF
jgi:hypothetical protein